MFSKPNDFISFIVVCTLRVAHNCIDGKRKIMITPALVPPHWEFAAEHEKLHPRSDRWSCRVEFSWQLPRLAWQGKCEVKKIFPVRCITTEYRDLRHTHSENKFCHIQRFSMFRMTNLKFELDNKITCTFFMKMFNLTLSSDGVKYIPVKKFFSERRWRANRRFALWSNIYSYVGSFALKNFQGSSWSFALFIPVICASRRFAVWASCKPRSSGSLRYPCILDHRFPVVRLPVSKVDFF